MLKHRVGADDGQLFVQPPSGGCVLKLLNAGTTINWESQPPSGGCVLKRLSQVKTWCNGVPAAFRRLCVETGRNKDQCEYGAPAAFRRLCVETLEYACNVAKADPAAFRRLCVETLISHLLIRWFNQPPSGGCVLKPVDA